MSDHYPLPGHAAYIWLSGDALMLGFPPMPGQTKGHSIALPLQRCDIELTDGGSVKASQSGWHALLTLLRDRASNHFTGKIGTAGEKTQHQADNLMKAIVASLSGERAEALRKEREEARKVLEDAGIEL